MHIKERWVPYVILVIVCLFAMLLVVHEVNKVYAVSFGDLTLRFGESKAGTFEAAAEVDDPNISCRLCVEKGKNSTYYDLKPNVYETFGFTYGSGNYRIALYQKDKKSNKKSNDYVLISEVTVNAIVDGMDPWTSISDVKPTTAKSTATKSSADKTISYDAVWELRKYAHTNKKAIDYWINVPEGATSGMPVVIFLHGDSEMGKPNSVAKLRQVKYMRESKDYIALAPVGEKRDWTSDRVQQALKGLIDDCIDRYQIDTDRVYIWGFSRGSIGTWGMVERYGSFFKAAVPISCGSYNGSSVKTENFKNTKIYALAGSKESRYIKQMRRIVDSIVKAGGLAKFETVAGQTHKTMSKNFPYAEVIDNWLLKQ